MSFDGIWIHLCGGNGAGKTSLLQDIRATHPHGDTYRYVFADSGGALPGVRGSGKIHDKYKAPKEVQWPAILADWDSEVPVIISDGTRIHYAIRNAHQHGARHRKMSVLILCQSPWVMKAHMQARCAKRGKPFKEDFWTPRNLLDIGRDHWQRFYHNYPLPLDLYQFEVDLEFSCIPYVRSRVLDLMALGKYLAMGGTDA